MYVAAVFVIGGWGSKIRSTGCMRPHEAGKNVCSCRCEARNFGRLNILIRTFIISSAGVVADVEKLEQSTLLF